MTEFKNQSGLKFTDISTELWRIYEFPGGTIVELKSPQFLNVSKSGGHRVFTEDGVSHYVPKGWIHLYWRVKQGAPNFVK